MTDYIEKHAQRHKRSWKEDRRILNSYVLPAWKHRAIADIARRDVRTLIEDVAERAPVMANRVLSCVREDVLVRRSITSSSSTTRRRGLRVLGAEQSRDRVLTDDEIRTLWAAFEALVAGDGGVLTSCGS